MAASVRIEDEAFDDPRIEVLGMVAGYNRFEALGRLAHLWRICTQRAAYVVSEAFIIGSLGSKGVEAILQADLGERTSAGIRVKGTAGRIEWMTKRREAGRAGGEANRKRTVQTENQTCSEGEAKPVLDEANVKQNEANGSQTTAKREPWGSGSDYSSGSGSDSGGGADPPPNDLVQKWYFFNPGGKPVSAREIAAMYDEIRRHGITDADIEAELRNPRRVRGEWPSKFRDRLIAEYKKRGQLSGPAESELKKSLRQIAAKSEVPNA